MEITVGIIEDHPDFREALASCLAPCPQFRLLAPCKDLPGGMEMLERDRPQVLLVDLGLPSGSGIGLIRQARHRHGDACTSAVLTVMGNEEHLMPAFAAGAKGYLFKSDSPQSWIQTVVNLARGVGFMHAGVAQMVGRHFEMQEPALAGLDPTHSRVLDLLSSGYTHAEVSKLMHFSEDSLGLYISQIYARLLKASPDLTPREAQLLRLLDRGYLIRECAELMGVAEATAKTHAKRAYEKLGATNVQMALYEARQAGILG